MSKMPSMKSGAKTTASSLTMTNQQTAQGAGSVSHPTCKTPPASAGARVKTSSRGDGQTAK